MTFKEDLETWNQKVDSLVTLIEGGLDIPPQLVKVRNGQHFIADGAHRHEALLRRTRDRYWTLWYAHDEKEFDCFDLEP